MSENFGRADAPKLTNGKLYGELRLAVKYYIAKNKTEFSECVDKSGHVEFVDENLLYILGHTDNDKDRLQYPGQQI